MRSDIDYASAIDWIWKNPLKIQRFLIKNFPVIDRDNVFRIMLRNPQEAIKLCINQNLTNDEKIHMIMDFMIKSKQLSLLAFGDQRQGKDATVCFFMDLAKNVLKNKLRICTLNNTKKPPWVERNDMYFSFRDIPEAYGDNQVWVYSSELETVLPAREGKSMESQLFSQLEGTFAQNQQKLIGCVKLASKVDLNAIRGCNMKMFKFISPDKLQVEGIERGGILSGLGTLLLPQNRFDYSKVLVSFDNNLLTVDVPLPKWWDEEYSQMYRGIDERMIREYVVTQHSLGLKAQQIIIAVNQKFRHKLTVSEIDGLTAG